MLYSKRQEQERLFFYVADFKQVVVHFSVFMVFFVNMLHVIFIDFLYDVRFGI